MEMNSKICLTCNNIFEGRSNKKYCCRKCWFTSTELKNYSKNKWLGNKNPMSSKKIKDIWVEKYGIKIAEQMELKTKRKMSKSKKGKNHPFYGKHHTENAKRKIAEKNKIKIISEKTKQKMKESAIKRILNNRSNIKYISKSETLFLNRLEQIYNIKIKRQFHIKLKIFDGLIEGTNILIECDCEYWHKNRKENDEFKNNLAKEKGYKLYRFEIEGIKQVEKKLVFYKELLDSIFN